MTCGTIGSVLKKYKKDTLTECCKTMATATWTYSMKYGNCITENEISFPVMQFAYYFKMF